MGHVTIFARMGIKPENVETARRATWRKTLRARLAWPRHAGAQCLRPRRQHHPLA